MSTTLINKSLKENYKIEINETLLLQLIKIVRTYEVRGEHPLSLNTPLLGVHKILFLKNDQDIIFDLFSKDEKELEKLIKTISSINKKFKVSSNTFNIFCSWLLHCIYVSNIKQELKNEALFCLLNYFQYRFFSSILSNLYPYKANEDIMSSVIQNLSLKFDITRYGTWKKVINNRTEYILSKESIHKKTLTTFENDADVLYFITDTQTRIRNQIIKINRLFHEYKEQSNLLRSYSITSEVDGEKVVKSKTFIFDNIANNLFSQMVYGNGDSFVSEKYIILLSKYFPNISPSMIRSLLIKISEVARSQKDLNEENKIVTKKGEQIIIGLRLLTELTMKFTYEYIINKNLNINNKLLIIQTTKRIYSYSRMINDDIQLVKRSIANLLDTIKLTNRAAYLSSLGIIFPMYIVIKSFDFIGKK